MKTLAELKAEADRLWAELEALTNSTNAKRMEWFAANRKLSDEMSESDVRERVRVKLEEVKK